MSDQEIISQLRTGQQHKALVKLYTHLPKVGRMVRNHGGTRADARDLFQDALIILLGISDRDQIHFEAAILIALIGFVGTVALAKFALRRDVME